VVPAEIGHAPYARPLLEYLASHFERVHVTAVREKLFPELSESVWLLHAEGYGGHTTHFEFAQLERFAFCDNPPAPSALVSVAEWRRWGHRLRPFLASRQILDMYESIGETPSSFRLGDVARVGIGYVTGANDFFHLSPSRAEALGIPKSFLKVTVRNGRMLNGKAVTRQTVASWLKADAPVLLLRLPPDRELPPSITKYLGSPEAEAAQRTYKCRHREPWYVVPDVVVPDAFFSYMSSGNPALVANEASCVGTNSVHVIRFKKNAYMARVQRAWRQPLTGLSCELEGHPLGGGMLKVEPGEAANVLLSNRTNWNRKETALIQEGASALRRWRHSGG
jgi:adenine-specific DNA-methyltransferase